MVKHNYMTVEELLAIHGGNVEKLAKTIGVAASTIYGWREAGKIPHGRQCQIEVESGYAFLSDWTVERHKREQGY